MPTPFIVDDQPLGQPETFRTPCGKGDLVWRRWGTGDPVILCHGGSGSWNHWIKTIPALAKHYEVWVPDLPGLGDSAMPPEPLTPASSASVLADGIRTLISPDQRIHLVAFSFGAQVATLAAIELGQQLADLTLIGTAALGLPLVKLNFPKERSSMTDAERREVHRGTLKILMFADRANIDDLSIELQAENVSKARFRSRDFAETEIVSEGLKHIAAPLRTIWGEHDVIASPSIEVCSDILRRYHPELVNRTIPGAGHWVMYEKGDAFNAALLELLSL